jgi:hypothetical protein
MSSRVLRSLPGEFADNLTHGVVAVWCGVKVLYVQGVDVDHELVSVGSFAFLRFEAVNHGPQNVANKVDHEHGGVSCSGAISADTAHFAWQAQFMRRFQ